MSEFKDNSAKACEIIKEACELPTQFQAALLLANAGIAVVPLLPDGSPAVKGGFHSRSSDTNDVSKKWQKGDYGIGIVPGDCGLICFDVDKEPALERVRELRGDSIPLMVTQTPRGGHGQHLWWPAPEGDYSKGENIGGIEGLDYRHNGGYICIRRDNNSKYENSNYKHRLLPNASSECPQSYIDLLVPKQVVSSQNGSALENKSLEIANVLFRELPGPDDNSKIREAVRKSVGPKIAEHLEDSTDSKDEHGQFLAFMYAKSENKSPEGLKIYTDNLKIFVHSGTLQHDLKIWRDGPWRFGELCAIREGYIKDKESLFSGLVSWWSKRYGLKFDYKEKSGLKLLKLLRYYDKDLILNTRAQMIEYLNAPFPDIDSDSWHWKTGYSRDSDSLRQHLREWLYEKGGFYSAVNSSKIFESRLLPNNVLDDLIVSASGINQHDPFEEWLNDLPEWDGVSYIATMLEQLYKLEPTEANMKLHGFAMFTLLGGAINRTINPGCKHDTIVVLSSRHQGIGKSSLFRNLFPSSHQDRWFNDSVALTDLTDPKHTVERVGDAVIVEISDNAGSYRAQRAELKSGITRQVDRSRLAFKKVTEDVPRRWVAVITSNDPGAVLKNDPSGNRRYIPIVIEGPHPDTSSMAESQRRIVNWLDKNRQQIWAEALYRIKAGEKPWATDVTTEQFVKVAGEGASQYDELTSALQMAIHRWDCRNLTTGEIAVLCGQGPQDTFHSGVLRDDWFNNDGTPTKGLEDYGKVCAGQRRITNALVDCLRNIGWQQTPYPKRRASGARVRLWESSEDYEPPNRNYVPPESNQPF